MYSLPQARAFCIRRNANGAMAKIIEPNPIPHPKPNPKANRKGIAPFTLRRIQVYRHRLVCNQYQ